MTGSKPTAPRARADRKLALLRAAERWRGVAILNRGRGQIGHAENEIRIAQRIMVAYSILSSPAHEDKVTDEFIYKNGDKSATEFVFELVQLFGGKLPGAPSSPGDVKRKSYGRGRRKPKEASAAPEENTLAAPIAPRGYSNG